MAVCGARVLRAAHRIFKNGRPGGGRSVDSHDGDGVRRAGIYGGYPADAMFCGSYRGVLLQARRRLEDSGETSAERGSRLFAALAVDAAVPRESFGVLMVLCIFAGLAVMFFARGERAHRIARSGACAFAFGVLGGFTTMIGNAAGPVMSVYLLSANLPKRSFVGTSAWFFCS